jgi:RNA polymerase sigma factor (sigma-70 family)
VSTAVAFRVTTLSRTRPSFTNVCDAQLDGVYRYLLHVVRNREVAEDLTSETFERALRVWSTYDPERGPAGPWLIRIARNAALDHFRSESRRRRREERAAVPDRVEGPDAAGALAPNLQAALGRLSPAEREVIALRVVLDYDTREAAGVLGISPTSCTTQLHRAMTRLRQEVERDA